MLFGFRRPFEAIQALTEALSGLDVTIREHGPAVERLEALERSRIHFEAECEGMLLKADGKLKAATSAEQRERQLKKTNDRLTDAFSEEETPAEHGGTHVLSANAPEGGAEGVPPVRLALASNNKAHAVKAKWGIA